MEMPVQKLRERSLVVEFVIMKIELTYWRVDSNDRIFPSFPFDHSRILQLASWKEEAGQAICEQSFTKFFLME